MGKGHNIKCGSSGSTAHITQQHIPTQSSNISQWKHCKDMKLAAEQRFAAAYQNTRTAQKQKAHEAAHLKWKVMSLDKNDAVKMGEKSPNWQKTKVFRRMRCFNLFQLPSQRSTDYIRADRRVFPGLWVCVQSLWRGALAHWKFVWISHKSLS